MIPPPASARATTRPRSIASPGTPRSSRVTRHRRSLRSCPIPSRRYTSRAPESTDSAQRLRRSGTGRRGRARNGASAGSIASDPSRNRGHAVGDEQSRERNGRDGSSMTTSDDAVPGPRLSAQRTRSSVVETSDDAASSRASADRPHDDGPRHRGGTHRAVRSGGRGRGPSRRAGVVVERVERERPRQLAQPKWFTTGLGGVGRRLDFANNSAPAGSSPNRRADSPRRRDRCRRRRGTGHGTGSRRCAGSVARRTRHAARTRISSTASRATT